MQEVKLGVFDGARLSFVFSWQRPGPNLWSGFEAEGLNYRAQLGSAELLSCDYDYVPPYCEKIYDNILDLDLGSLVWSFSICQTVIYAVNASFNAFIRRIGLVFPL